MDDHDFPILHFTLSMKMANEQCCVPVQMMLNNSEEEVVFLSMQHDARFILLSATSPVKVLSTRPLRTVRYAVRSLQHRIHANTGVLLQYHSMTY